MDPVAFLAALQQVTAVQQAEPTGIPTSIATAFGVLLTAMLGLLSFMVRGSRKDSEQREAWLRELVKAGNEQTARGATALAENAAAMRQLTQEHSAATRGLTEALNGLTRKVDERCDTCPWRVEAERARRS